MGYHSTTALRSVLAITALFCFVNAADAKLARCHTTDDGSYQCQFRATDRDGSFEISAPGKPSYLLNMIAPGIASGFVNFGTRNIPLPGRYLRNQTDPACWMNDATNTSICAW